MAKFFGEIGYATTAEEIVDGKTTGIWISTIVERPHYGDVNRYIRRYLSGDKINDDVDINNEISIVADSFAMENFQNMKYVRWLNARWKISSVEVSYPRLIITLGGIYNGDTPAVT